MPLQTQVYQYQSRGIPGEFADSSPRRVAPYIVNATAEAMPIVGYAFTQGTNDNDANVGGTGAFLGVLVEPKQYANYMNLEPTLTLKNGSIGEICSFGHIFVKSTTAVKPNYVAAFDPATGAISAYVDADTATTAKMTLIPNAKFIQISAEIGDVAILELNN